MRPSDLDRQGTPPPLKRGKKPTDDGDGCWRKRNGVHLLHPRERDVKPEIEYIKWGNK